MENTLQLQQQKQRTSLTLMKSKPNLAVLNEDFPKLKNVVSKEETNNLMNYILAILNIKVSSPEEKTELNNQMIVIHDFLKTKFGHLTIPEIKEAFKMYVAKEFQDIKVFRLLDCISVGEVLTAYINFRNDSLRVYDDKKRLLLAEAEPTSEEKKKEIRNDFLKQIFEDLKARGYSSEIWILWEKDFKSKELTDFANKVNATVTNSEKREMYAREEQMYMQQIKTEMMTSRLQSAKWVVENASNQIKVNQKINSVINRCRCLIGSKYLKNYLTDFEEFKKQIDNELDGE
ncbi:MAG: hypothetical protein H7Z76_13530 [Methylotenera sp.]|nr:hypothetical protein [Flavobacterium sp.]